MSILNSLKSMLTVRHVISICFCIVVMAATWGLLIHHGLNLIFGSTTWALCILLMLIALLYAELLQVLYAKLTVGERPTFRGVIALSSNLLLGYGAWQLLGVIAFFIDKVFLTDEKAMSEVIAFGILGSASLFGLGQCVLVGVSARKFGLISLSTAIALLVSIVALVILEPRIR